MRHFADKNLASRHTGTLRLSVAPQTEIVIALEKKLGVDRSVRLMANSATLSQRLVLENKWPSLFPMTLGAGLVEPRHGQAARRFHDVHSVRIMTLRAVHLCFQDGMMLGQFEFGVRFEVAREASSRVLAGVNNEVPTATAHCDMLAAGPVA
jgi:hypothetical protein